MKQTMEINGKKFSVRKFDNILKRGLCTGVGDRAGQMCIEAVICTVLDLPHGDDPMCVSPSVRRFKIALNDKKWTSPEARAVGLRDLGLAQLGSLGVVDSKEFSKRLATKTIRVLIPAMARDLFSHNTDVLAGALRCEKAGQGKEASEASWALRNIFYQIAAYAAYADDAYAVYAAYAAAAYGANADANAYAIQTDKYLLLSAALALEVLVELKSPGVALLNKKKRGQ